MTALDPEVFDGAATRIRRGWGRLHGAERSLSAARPCALMALTLEFQELHPGRQLTTYGEVVNPYTRLLAEVLGGPSTGYDALRTVARFNDVEAFDAEEVAAVLETCAEKVRAEETWR